VIFKLKKNKSLHLAYSESGYLCCFKTNLNPITATEANNIVRFTRKATQAAVEETVEQTAIQAGAKAVIGTGVKVAGKVLGPVAGLADFFINAESTVIDPFGTTAENTFNFANNPAETLTMALNSTGELRLKLGNVFLPKQYSLINLARDVNIGFDGETYTLYNRGETIKLALGDGIEKKGDVLEIQIGGESIKIPLPVGYKKPDSRTKLANGGETETPSLEEQKQKAEKQKATDNLNKANTRTRASLRSNTRFVIDHYTESEINTNHNYEVESKKVVKQAVDLIQAGKSYKEILDSLAVERGALAGNSEFFGKERTRDGFTPVVNKYTGYVNKLISICVPTEIDFSSDESLYVEDILFPENHLSNLIEQDFIQLAIMKNIDSPLKINLTNETIQYIQNLIKQNPRMQRRIFRIKENINNENFQLTYISNIPYIMGSPYSNETREFTILHTAPRHFPLIHSKLETIHNEILQTTDKKQTINKLAEFYWWMSQACFFERGSAAISDWYLDALAKTKGINIIGWKDGIDPNLEAILSPKEEFIKNFKNLGQIEVIEKQAQVKPIPPKEILDVQSENRREYPLIGKNLNIPEKTVQLLSSIESIIPSNVIIRHFPDNYQGFPTSTASYNHALEGTEESGTKVIAIKGNWQDIVKTMRSEVGEKVWNIIANKCNLPSLGKLSDEYIYTFLLLHEIGHSIDHSGKSKERYDSQKIEEYNLLPSKANSYGQFIKSNPKATEEEIIEYLTKYRNLPSESFADNFAAEQIK
jgi:Avirulence protein